jgi:hypothetical protein
MALVDGRLLIGALSGAICKKFQSALICKSRS